MYEKEANITQVEFEVALNDLFENDLNTIFKWLAPFYDKLKEEKGGKFVPCFISGVAGSFYGRLFRSKSLHFVHSSYCLHWTSRVRIRTTQSFYLNWLIFCFVHSTGCIDKFLF